MARCLSVRLRSKRMVQAKLGMYLLAPSLAAASPAERRVMARRGWAGENGGHFDQSEDECVGPWSLVNQRPYRYSYETSSLPIDTLRSEVIMPSAKEQIAKILQDQPDDSSYDEILRELAFVRMVEQGLADSDAGRTISHEEMKCRIDAFPSRTSWAEAPKRMRVRNEDLLLD
jgi:hypothetical protein